MRNNLVIRSLSAAAFGIALCLGMPAFAQELPLDAPRAKGAAAAKSAAPAAKDAAKKGAAQAPKSLGPWRSNVIAHLNSRKRGVAGGAGIVTVAFKIDRSGKVMSAQVVNSSGNKALDGEAIALTRRASPVPPPPADVAGAVLYLKVPIRFSR